VLTITDDSEIAIRYETWLRPDALRWPGWIEDHWDRINSGLRWFEQNHGGLEQPLNVCHLALGSLLGYIDFRWPDNGWRDRFPTVCRWFDELERRPSFLQTKPALAPSS
jgi:glutathione S-transferase